MPMNKKGSALLIIFFMLVIITFIATAFIRSLGWYADIMHGYKYTHKRSYLAELFIVHLCACAEKHPTGSTVYISDNHTYLIVWEGSTQDSLVTVTFRIQRDQKSWAHGVITLKKDTNAKSLLFLDHTILFMHS